MNNVKIPFASYQKKAYNYGFIEVKEPISIENFYSKTLKDLNSTILINSSNVGKVNKNINQIVYREKINLLKND